MILPPRMNTSHRKDRMTSAISTRRLLVLDDDPTGSQCVSGVSAAFSQDPQLLSQTLSAPGQTCFTLINSRALEEPAAVEVNQKTLRGVLESLSDEARASLHVVSRSDSTLRGHVIAEPHALADVLDEYGISVDGFLFSPAMIEAGRLTRDDLHYATVGGEQVLVGETDFAQDATFGYSSSNLVDFLVERSAETDHPVKRSDVLTVSLQDIRHGGEDRVREILGQAAGRQWIVLNAESYEDLETITAAVTAQEQAGKVFLTRCAPSLLRPLAGQTQPHLLDAAEIRDAEGSGSRAEHGLLVVGSHVELTTEQLTEVRRRGGLLDVEISVPQILDDGTREEHLQEVIRTACEGLSQQDVVIYTSRELVKARDREQSLRIARSVSDAVVEVVRGLRSARPAWVIAKGGITSHEVALQGLGIKQAEVLGQFFPGQISLFHPTQAPEEVLGCPYIVFPGNVGSRESLADVVERLQEATA